jgi:glyoxylase-like metal-dependent hydrolase (beta-lactamase superfamily II)
MATSRRRFLRALGGAGAALCGWGGAIRAPRAQTASQPLAATELRGGLVQITGAGCNVVVAPRPEGLLVVDSGSAERGADLKKLLTERFGAAPVEVLFNTHWHLEHTGGTEAITDSTKSTIIAHEHTRLWMSTKFYVDWEDRRYFPRPPAARPNKTFVSSDPQPLDVSFGNERIEYAHLAEAHTDGDIYVRFPDRNIIVAGGAVTAGAYPTLDYITGGWMGGLVMATQRLIELADADTLIVPEVGAVQRRSDLEAQLDMLSTVRQRIEALALQGRGVDEIVEAGITKEYDARYGSGAAEFLALAYEGMWWKGIRGTVA